MCILCCIHVLILFMHFLLLFLFLDLKCLDLPPPRSITHPFTCTASKFHVCSILPSTLPSIAQPLLQLMFYNNRLDHERVNE